MLLYVLVLLVHSLRYLLDVALDTAVQNGFQFLRRQFE